MLDTKKGKAFIVFACAGCSRAGQAAYSVALGLDKHGTAEMSCLAGIASGKPSFFRKIKDNRVITIDGCTTECSKGVFDNAGIRVDVHIKLKEYGIRKNGPVNDYDIKRLVEEVGKEASSLHSKTGEDVC